MASPPGTIDVTFKDDIAIVTMDCGENRISGPFIDRLNEAFDEVLRNPNVKAMVTRGTGRFYSNGIDLAWLAETAQKDVEKVEEFHKRKGRSIYWRLLSFPIVTVALVNGHAFAGGALLALVHDHVIMNSKKGFLCFSEVHLKIKLHPATNELFNRKLGHGQTLHEAVVLGRRYTGESAKQAGIAQSACSVGDMLPSAMSWLRKVLPPGGYDRQHLQTMREDAYKPVFDKTLVDHVVSGAFAKL